MRKALFLVLMAATAALPAPAMAQDGAEQTREERRAARQERREQRQQQRADRPERQQQAAPPQQQPQQQAVRADAGQRREARVERRNDNSVQGWIGNPNDPRMEAHRRRYERLDRQNARQNGTQEQYQAVVQQQRAQRVDRRDDRRDFRQDRREDRREFRQDRRDDRRDFRQDVRQDRRAWSRDWRRDQRYNWQDYRNYNRNIFRSQPYYAPYRNYSYSRFSIGMILDQLFFGRNYWLSDPGYYRLPQAPYGYQWVRYYDDVLLVDTYTGRVVDVIYDFFW